MATDRSETLFKIIFVVGDYPLTKSRRRSKQDFRLAAFKNTGINLDSVKWQNKKLPSTAQLNGLVNTFLS